jgi:hypothetical protein
MAIINYGRFFANETLIGDEDANRNRIRVHTPARSPLEKSHSGDNAGASPMVRTGG